MPKIYIRHWNFNMLVKLNSTETLKVIGELLKYNPITGSIFNVKTEKYISISKSTKQIGLLYKDKSLRITPGIAAYILMNGKYPTHRIYRIDKEVAFKWDNLSSSRPMIRRTRERILPKGVSLLHPSKLKDTSKNKYQVTIFLDKLYSLGRFSNIEDAKLAYDTCLKQNKVIKFTGKFKTEDIDTYREKS